MDKIPEFLASFRGNIRYVKSADPGFEYSYQMSGIPEIDEKHLLEETEMLLGRLEELF